jgi:predicted P-loop ATPase
MSTSIKDVSILARKASLVRFVGTAIAEGATADAIAAYLIAQGAATQPDVITDIAARRRRLPTLGRGELTLLGGRDAIRAALGLPPAPLVQSDFVLDDKDRPDAQNQENIRLALTKLGYEFSYDAFAGAVTYTTSTESGPVDDAVITRAWLSIDTEFDFRPSRDFFEYIVDDFARQNTIHPVLDFLASLQPWDGTPRLDTWLTTYAGAADNEYVRAVGALPLIAAVRRVRQRYGVKVDELLVLYGPQGPGKSKLLAALCPKPEWFTDGLSLGDDPKRAIENSRGIWISEIPELQGTQREIEKIKAYLSRSVDGPVRLAYAHLPVRVPRQFVNFGSTNEEFFLKDPTGNRRFWPITVGSMRPDLLIRDRDQLWAEAALRESQGASIHLPEALWPLAAAAQEAHLDQDPWEELLAEKTDGYNVVPVAFTWGVVGLGLENSRRDNRAARRITDAMKRLGFVAKKNLKIAITSTTDKTMYCYVKDRDQAGLKMTDLPQDPF